MKQDEKSYSAISALKDSIKMWECMKEDLLIKERYLYKIDEYPRHACFLCEYSKERSNNGITRTNCDTCPALEEFAEATGYNKITHAICTLSGSPYFLYNSLARCDQDELDENVFVEACQGMIDLLYNALTRHMQEA